MAYRLNFPIIAKLHSVFHVSKLKTFVGDPQAEHRRLLEELIQQHPLRDLEEILNSREVLKQGSKFKEILVLWKDQLVEDVNDFYATFLNFILKDKDNIQGGQLLHKG